MDTISLQRLGNHLRETASVLRGTVDAAGKELKSPAISYRQTTMNNPFGV
jgi:hypothetical protein